jgi:hypothetical protein
MGWDESDAQQDLGLEPTSQQAWLIEGTQGHLRILNEMYLGPNHQCSP